MPFNRRGLPTEDLVIMKPLGAAASPQKGTSAARTVRLTKHRAAEVIRSLDALAPTAVTGRAGQVRKASVRAARTAGKRWQKTELAVQSGLDSLRVHLDNARSERETGKAQTLESRAAAAQRSIDRQQMRLDMTPFFRQLGSGELSADPTSDTDLLRVIGHSLVTCEPVKFAAMFDQLLSQLGERTARFEDESFTDGRFAGWCSAVNNAFGLLYVANRHFLYQVGEVIPRQGFSDRFPGLMTSGIVEMERRFGVSVSGPGDWAEADGTNRPNAGRLLANALNYFARDAYAFDSSKPLNEVLVALGNTNFDVLIRYSNFPVAPYSNPEDPFLQAVSSALDQLAAYYLAGKDSIDGSYLELFRRPDRPARSADTMFRLLFRGCVVHERADLLAALVEAFELQPEDAFRLTGVKEMLFGTAWGTQSVQSEASNAAVDSWLANVDEVDQSGSVVAKLERAAMLVSIGSVDAARSLVSSIDDVAGLSIAQMHRLLEVAPKLTTNAHLYRLLVKVRRKLVVLGPTMLHNVNYCARVVQYLECADDCLLIENSNQAIGALLAGEREQKNPKDDRKVVLFAVENCRVVPGLIAPLIPALVEGGFEFANLQFHRFGGNAVPLWQHTPVLDDSLTSVNGVKTSIGALLGEWDIRPADGVIELDGVNYYEGIYEKISRTLKVFNVDWSMPAVRVWCRSLVTKIDRTVYALDRVRAYAAAEHVHVRFVTLQSHFAPGSAVRAYCEAHPEWLEHITISASYENWKTNVAGEPLATMAILNNTIHPSPSLPAFGTREHFGRWLVESFAPNRAKYVATSEALTSIDRAGVRTPEAEEWLAHARSARGGGRRVFCLLGKIPYDLAVPYQGGPAHSSMADWLNHTVETIGTTDNVLYVKPHPHELNLSISARCIESFADLIHVPSADNVHVLPHRGVNMRDLLEVVDVFLVWNGSSIAEIGAQGGVVLAADDWAARNYPIGVQLPNDRSHFESILRGESEIAMPDDFKELSLAYTCYLTEAPFALPNVFVHRSSTNTQFNRAWVKLHEIDEGSLDTMRSFHGAIRSTFN